MNTIGGVEFLVGTNNYAICGAVAFRTHDLSTGKRITNTYQLNIHPDGWTLQQEQSPGGWTTIKSRVTREDVLALLPESGMAWTWQLFCVAFTAYGYGVDDGVVSRDR